MGIRFFVPFPGPFYYAPGRKHPKPQTSAFAQATQDLANRNSAHLHKVAYAVATECAYPEPREYADAVVTRTDGERTVWGVVVILVMMAAMALMVGPGVILVGLIPVIGAPVLILLGIPAAALALFMSRRDRVLRVVAQEFGMIAESGRHRR